MGEDSPPTFSCCPEADEAYAVHSKEKGLISCHPSEGEAINAFAVHAMNIPDTDALIYRREDGRWKVV